MPRRASRKRIAAQVMLRRSGEINYRIHVYDLSEFGCKAEFVERPLNNEIVWVKFDGLHSLEATVRWTEGFYVGLEFSHKMDPRVMQNLIGGP